MLSKSFHPIPFLEAALNVSSASEQGQKIASATEEGPQVGGGANEKMGGAQETGVSREKSDSAVFTLHLTLPGVPQPVDVVVRNSHHGD